MELGLERGVDITDPTPWNHKTICQVRTVTGENTIKTEEGGGEQSFEREVRNASETRGNFNALISDPSAALSFGVEGEYSHSTSSLYRVVGTQVLNSTITFKPDGPDGDNPLGDGSGAADGGSRAGGGSGAGGGSRAGGGSGAADGRSRAGGGSRAGGDSGAGGESGAGGVSESTDDKGSDGDSGCDTFKKLFSGKLHDPDKCFERISQIKITHYIWSIRLGASEYEVRTESRKNRWFGVGGSVGVKNSAAGGVFAGHSNSSLEKCTEVQKVGIIERKDGIVTVKRCCNFEAVVGIKVKPISDLFTEPEDKIMKEALEKYINKKRSTSDACE